MTSIKNDGHYVNLWDLLTDLPPITKSDGVCQGVMDMIDADRAQGQKVKDLLSATARWGQQEFSLHVDDDAWRIEIFSCHDGASNPLLKLVIPMDREKPVRVETVDAPVEVVVPERRELVTP